MLKKAFDSQALTKTLLPAETWANKIFSPELYASEERETNIFTTNNGCCEARLYLKGEEDIIGLHYDDVPGSTFREKRSLFARMTIDNLKELVQEKNGLAYRGHFEDMRLLIIPSGRLVINASNGATYMRWGVYCDDADLARVSAMLEAVLTSFPEFKNPAYPMHKFHEFLTDHLTSPH